MRTAAYRSGDPVMIGLFETKQDLYIHVAKIYFGEERWNAFGKTDKKKWRKNFKTTLLGVMYGMGAKRLTRRIITDLSIPSMEIPLDLDLGDLSGNPMARSISSSS